MDTEETDEDLICKKDPENGTLINCKNNLIKIQYPGYIKNIDKVLETLGGIENIENVVGDSNKNLELRFRPKNFYSKPVIGDREENPSILLKVKVLKKVLNGKVVEKEIVHHEIVGISDWNFKFTKLCDYQYLPLLPKNHQVESETDLEYIYNDLFPKDLPTADWISSEKSESMPLFFNPTQFSKVSTSNNQPAFEKSKLYEGYLKYLQPLFYENTKNREIQQKNPDFGDSLKNIFSRITHCCYFNDEVPLEPKNAALVECARQNLPAQSIEKLKKLFEERPIWSRAALNYHAGLKKDQMRFLMPLVAFYYLSGPWRAMWVRIGYDPKKDPLSRNWQIFDYRVPIKGFRVNFKTGLGVVKSSDPVFSKQRGISKGEGKKLQENSVFLRPGLLPSSRQIFYQYCDVHLPEIQAMFAKLPRIMPGTQCHSKHGWLPRGFADHCREATNKYVMQFIRELSANSNDPESSQANENSSNSDISSSDEESEQDEDVLYNEDDESDIEDCLNFDLETAAEINAMLNVDNREKAGPSSKNQ